MKLDLVESMPLNEVRIEYTLMHIPSYVSSTTTRWHVKTNALTMESAIVGFANVTLPTPVKHAENLTAVPLVRRYID